jgi:hypothetical protein
MAIKTAVQDGFVVEPAQAGGWVVYLTTREPGFQRAPYAAFSTASALVKFLDDQLKGN